MRGARQRRHVVRQPPDVLDDAHDKEASFAGRGAGGVSLASLGATALRLVVALWCHGTAHPDELLQSGEASAGWALGVRASLPWEWRAEQPARSAAAALLPAGLALRVVRLFGLERCALAALLAPRLALVALAAAADAAVGRVAEAAGRDASRARAALALAWPGLALLPRPLGNAAEALLVAACAAVALRKEEEAPPTALTCFALGALAALATFVRFTAPAFVAPLCLAAVIRGTGDGAPSLRVRAALAGVAGAAAAAVGCVALDTAWFARGEVVLAPLNSLRYNADAANLATHGLHPRATHALVNAPMLFLPLVVGVACSWRGWRREPAAARALLASALLPVAALSLAPHQEPRFLLPLLVPLAALGGDWSLSTHRRALLAVAFNAPLLAFHAVAHQGGLFPSLVWLADAGNVQHALGLADIPERVAVTYMHTYMPPEHLLVQPAGEPPRVALADVMDEPDAGRALDVALAGSACAGDAQHHAERTCALLPADAPRLLVAPRPSVASEPVRRAARARGVRLTRLASFWPHLGTERIAEVLAHARSAGLADALHLDVVALLPDD